MSESLSTNPAVTGTSLGMIEPPALKEAVSKMISKTVSQNLIYSRTKVPCQGENKVVKPFCAALQPAHEKIPKGSILTESCFEITRNTEACFIYKQAWKTLKNC